MLGSLMRAVHRPIYQRRMEVLGDLILPLLRPADRVLDVGCGSGAIGRWLLDAPNRPADLSVRGLERYPRENPLIDVDPLTTERFPYDDGAFDVVMVLDMLHHDADMTAVLRECRRVSRRCVILKDHKPDGPLAQRRISLLDWAANRPYGVACLYRYPTHSEWHALFREVGLTPTQEIMDMRLYPAGWNWFFAGRLHYFAALDITPAP